MGRPDLLVGLPDVGSCPPPPPGAIEATYLLALSVSVRPELPILALVDVTTPPFMDGTGIALELQALAAADRATPVTPPIPLRPFPILEDGSFRIELFGFLIPGAANPITGENLIADVIIAGSACFEDPSFLCGAVGGSLTLPQPLALTGSTFGMTLVEDPAELPERPVVNCAGDRAGPLDE